jgi:predicted dehydrogenase
MMRAMALLRVRCAAGVIFRPAIYLGADRSANQGHSAGTPFRAVFAHQGIGYRFVVNRVRIAVTGAGTIGLRHIEEIGKSRSTTLAAIVDPSPRAATIASRLRVPIFRSLDELIARRLADGVIVATPNAMHVDQALQCIAAGLAVLVEKPIAHTLRDGERFVDAAERANAKLLVGHHRLHSPILRKAVETIRSGMLGPIVAVVGTAVFYKPAGYFEGANAWRKESGGGPILVNMIHEVANLRAMVGEIVTVSAFASNATRKFAVEDSAAMALRFENGALGTFLLSDTGASPMSWEQTSRENAQYPTYPDEDAYIVVGTRGSLFVPTMRVKYYEQDGDRSWFTPFREATLPLERADPLALQIEHFAAVVRREAKPLVSGRDGLRNLRVIDAIAEAARTGKAVNVDIAR